MKNPPDPTSVTYFRPRRKGPEILLEDAVARAIPDLFDAGTHLRWTGGSVPIGAGLPDLLIVNCNSALLTLAKADLPAAEILAYLKIVGCATADTIAESTKRSLGKTVRALDQLQEVRAIAKARGNQQFRLTRRWGSILPEVIAVEVKVFDWQKAVSQAARNRIFSHRSYVALPLKAALRIRREKILSHFGIGLLGIDKLNQLWLLRRSRRSQPRVWSYYYEIASLAARHLTPKD